jgi:hypothetical protein
MKNRKKKKRLISLNFNDPGDREWEKKEGQPKVEGVCNKLGVTLPVILLLLFYLRKKVKWFILSISRQLLSLFKTKKKKEKKYVQI